MYTVGESCAVSMSWYRYVLACDAVISAYMLSFALERWISTMPPRPSTLVSVWLDFQPNLAASNPLRWTHCLDASPLPLRAPLISTSPCAGSTLAKLYLPVILDWLTMFCQSWSKSLLTICFGRPLAAYSTTSSSDASLTVPEVLSLAGWVVFSLPRWFDGTSPAASEEFLS